MPRRLFLPAFFVLLCLPMLLFAVSRSVDGLDPTLRAPTGHFYIVSATALLAAAIASALLIGVESLRETRTLFLALGFIGLAIIFGTHGLSTPGFIVKAEGYPYGVVISAGLSEIVAAGFIFLSVLPEPWLPSHAIRRVAPWAIGFALVSLTAYAAITLVHPRALDVLPHGEQWDAVLAGTTMTLLGLAAWRYWRAYRLTRFPGQLAMVTALVLLAEAQVSMYFGDAWQFSWWIYHFLLLGAFLSLVAGWAIEAHRAQSLLLFSRALSLRDRLDAVDLADPATLDALEHAMAGKDQYTKDHMGRVARYAAAIADELGCDERTRQLAAVAGRIHDIGKIAVPDHILLKPGKLTTDEFTQMKHHAARGAAIARESKVLGDVADVVRAHHERFAGGGYPDGLAGDAIPLAARIVAVADTFDALTSARVYRPERPLDQALAEIRRVSGTQLDPVCVEAFFRVIARDGLAHDELPLAA